MLRAKTSLWDGSKKKRSKYGREESVQGTLMILAPLLGFVIFSVFPMLLSLVVSFTELQSYDVHMMSYVGVNNYVRLFTNKWFYRSIQNTLTYCLCVPINIAISLFLANLLSKNVKLKAFSRTVFYLPTVCSTVAVVLMWQWILEPNYGVFNTVLSSVGLPKIAFTTTEEWFFPSIYLMSIWINGTNVLFLQTALSNVDASLKEAAEIDGASGSKLFFNIVIPSISPTLFYVLVTWLIVALQEMAIMQLVATNGIGPGFKAVTLTYYIYRMGIQNIATEGFGRASALSWVVAIFIVIVSRILFKLGDKFVCYD